MFTMNQVMNSFHGNYQNQQSMNVPNPRPSQCPTNLTYQHLVFSRKKIIMEQEVISEAIVAETTSKSRFNSIEVDFKPKTYDAKTSRSDVLFIGTGKLIDLLDTFISHSIYSVKIFDFRQRENFNICGRTIKN